MEAPTGRTPSVAGKEGSPPCVPSPSVCTSTSFPRSHTRTRASSGGTPRDQHPKAMCFLPERYLAGRRGLEVNPAVRASMIPGHRPSCSSRRAQGQRHQLHLPAGLGRPHRTGVNSLDGPDQLVPDVKSEAGGRPQRVRTSAHSCPPAPSTSSMRQHWALDREMGDVNMRNPLSMHPLHSFPNSTGSRRDT
jgi:hypothetical protein